MFVIWAGSRVLPPSSIPGSSNRLSPRRTSPGFPLFISPLHPQLGRQWIEILDGGRKDYAAKVPAMHRRIRKRRLHPDLDLNCGFLGFGFLWVPWPNFLLGISRWTSKRKQRLGSSVGKAYCVLDLSQAEVSYSVGFPRGRVLGSWMIGGKNVAQRIAIAPQTVRMGKTKAQART